MDNKCLAQPCLCQRYRAKDDIGNECLYCNHSICYHENVREHPFGQCLLCPCQCYKPGTSHQCVHCLHYDGFHLSLPNNNQSVSTVASSSTIQLNSQTQPIYRNYAGRPTANAITIKYLICFDKVSGNKIPKDGTDAWNNLKSKNLIKENVEFSQSSSPEEIYNQIHNLFFDKLNGRKWVLYTVRSGCPIVVTDELSFDMIKSNVTKAKKKLYIGPSDLFDNSFDMMNNGIPLTYVDYGGL